MYLPVAPNNKEKRKYLKPNKFLLYSFGTISYTCLLTGMALFAKNFHWFIPFVVITGFYLLISYFIGIFGRRFDYKKHLLAKRAGKDYRPSVDVFLPCCGEPIDILINTYNHVVELRKHYKGEMNVYILDDKGSQAVQIAAVAKDFHYISRPNKGELKKAGNMRYAFPLTKGEIIFVLDADFCPRLDFLDETIHYFKDPKIAILQTPQFFSIEDEQSWIEKGAGYVQELFYRLIQVNRDTWDAAICVGTCALYRRTALEPFGGTAPIAYSEDLHTGFQVIQAGWKVKYIPVNMAKGVCPDRLSGYFTQQYRWCMGSTSLGFSKKFWTTKLPIMMRLNYMSGMLYYISTGLGTFLTPIPGLYMIWFHPEHVLWFNWVFSLPSLIFGYLYMAVWTKAPFGFYSFRARIAAYYAHLFALRDKVLGSTMPWVPTGGGATRVALYEKFKSVLFWWSTIYFTIAIAGCFYRMTSLLDYNFYPMLFFSCFNYWMQMSILKEEA